MLGYYVYRDLRRGWRITSPNLEQCGLLEIDYLSLGEFCAAQEEWEDCHPALNSAEDRDRVSRVLMDYMRRELAIRGWTRGRTAMSVATSSMRPR